MNKSNQGKINSVVTSKGSERSKIFPRFRFMIVVFRKMVLGFAVVQIGASVLAANLRDQPFDSDWRFLRADVPGYVDVKGVSFATNTLTVNSQTAYCKGEYFRKELSVANRLHHTKQKNELKNQNELELV